MLSHGLDCRKHICMPLKVPVKIFSRPNAFPWEAAIATLIWRDIINWPWLPIQIFLIITLPFIPPSIILLRPSVLLRLNFYSCLSCSLLSLFVLLQLGLFSFLRFLLFSLGCWCLYWPRKFSRWFQKTWGWTWFQILPCNTMLLYSIHVLQLYIRCDLYWKDWGHQVSGLPCLHGWTRVVDIRHGRLPRIYVIDSNSMANYQDGSMSLTATPCPTILGDHRMLWPLLGWRVEELRGVSNKNGMKTVFNQTLQVLQSMREMQKVAMKNQTRLAWMNVSIKNGFQSNTVNTECEGHVKYCEK